MININREVNAPAYLLSGEIQQYITDAIAHLANPVNVPKPQKPGGYRNSDLLEAFDRNFHAKCYLTEEAYSNSWTMDIEHFFSQVERPDLVYEWTNLYPAEHLANMMKPRGTPVGGYLDPCDPADDVENEIVYTLSDYGFDPDFSVANAGNIQAENTCDLLNRLHNGHDYDTKKATASLRHAIQKKYIEILKKIICWQHHANGTQEKQQVTRELKDLLSRKSSYTMLCRSIPSVRQYLPAGFFD